MSNIYFFVDFRSMIAIEQNPEALNPVKQDSEEHDPTRIFSSGYFRDFLKKLSAIRDQQIKIIPFSGISAEQNIMMSIRENLTIPIPYNWILNLYPEYLKGLIDDGIVQCEINSEKEMIFPPLDALRCLNHRITNENICVISPNQKLLDQVEKTVGCKVSKSAISGELFPEGKKSIQHYIDLALQGKKIKGKFHFDLDLDETLLLLTRSFAEDKVVINDSLLKLLQQFKELYPDTTFSILTSRTHPLECTEKVLGLAKFIVNLKTIKSENNEINKLLENLRSQLQTYEEMREKANGDHNKILEIIHHCNSVLKTTVALLSKLISEKDLQNVKHIAQEYTKTITRKLKASTTIDKLNEICKYNAELLQTMYDIYNPGFTPENVCKIIKDQFGLDIEIREHSYTGFEINKKRKGAVIQENMEKTKDGEPQIRFMVDDNLNEINFASELHLENLHLCPVYEEGGLNFEEIDGFLSQVKSNENEKSIEGLLAEFSKNTLRDDSEGIKSLTEASSNISCNSAFSR